MDTHYPAPINLNPQEPVPPWWHTDTVYIISVTIQTSHLSVFTLNVVMLNGKHFSVWLSNKTGTKGGIVHPMLDHWTIWNWLFLLVYGDLLDRHQRKQHMSLFCNHQTTGIGTCIRTHITVTWSTKAKMLLNFNSQTLYVYVTMVIWKKQVKKSKRWAPSGQLQWIGAHII